MRNKNQKKKKESKKIPKNKSKKIKLILVTNYQQTTKHEMRNCEEVLTTTNSKLNFFADQLDVETNGANTKNNGYI